MQPSATLRLDPAQLAHRYDATADRIGFRPVSRAQRASVPFLTDEYLGEAAPRWIDRREALAATDAPAPMAFIFHAAFCGSTLLAQAFDVAGVATSAKEPVLLNDIVGSRVRTGMPAARVAELMDNALRLLARPYEAGETVVVKPSNLINPLVPLMMTLRTDAPALLMHAPLPVFLRSVARKGLWGRVWVRDLLIKLTRDGYVNLGIEPASYMALTDLQCAAVGWLAQRAGFAEVVKRFGERRVRTLDSENFLADPAATLKALAAHFRVALDDAQIATMVAGPPFTIDSKTGKGFSRDQRLAAYAAAGEAHADEIGKVEQWADAVAASAGISLDPLVPLLG